MSAYVLLRMRVTSIFRNFDEFEVPYIAGLGTCGHVCQCALIACKPIYMHPMPRRLYLHVPMCWPSLRTYSEYVSCDNKHGYIRQAPDVDPLILLVEGGSTLQFQLKAPGSQSSIQMEMVWLVQTHKTEDYHLYIEKLQL